MSNTSWKLEIIGNEGNLRNLTENILGTWLFQERVILSDEASDDSGSDAACVILNIPDDEVTEELIADLERKALVVLCGDSDPKLLHKASAELLYDYLRRPVDQAELQMKLRNIGRYIQQNIQAKQDFLTELPNRRGLYEYYRAMKPQQSIHILYMDIDNFKKVNDIFGHRFGDSVLVEIANRLRTAAGGAFISRIGGDEFVILLDGSRTRMQVEQLLKDILSSLHYRYEREGDTATISASIGALLHCSAGQRFDDLLDCCDKTMYRAKQKGKNQYCIHG